MQDKIVEETALKKAFTIAENRSLSPHATGQWSVNPKTRMREEDVLADS